MSVDQRRLLGGTHSLMLTAVTAHRGFSFGCASNCETPYISMYVLQLLRTPSQSPWRCGYKVRARVIKSL